ncbi:MAG TPA: 3-oxoacyl-[acyl-carrier-protein] reductase [Candidatus Dormibacteraeota bacterium]|jgi:3-oxoacyl-[acyl-carrier protein] reductase|nr:3-oxoacyl-[acyl-carrier-protein] reductase [Candidatus Dormibacteraeota bacterium]
MADQRLAGKVALVTGASRGIGRASAMALAADGAAIAVAYGSRADAAAEVVDDIQRAGGQAAALAADLEDIAAATGLVDAAIAALGRLDILVNNAGFTRDALAVRMSDADWTAVLTVNLTAAFVLCRAALRPMLRQRWGRIINVTSVAGVTGNPGQANYSAAKAGVIGLTKSLAKEVGSRGITVNAVAPGFIETDLTAPLDGTLRERALSMVPLGRMGSADEVAAAIAFLASPGATYVNGCVLHVDGGMAF